MSYTTNTATKSLAATYADRRRECESLFKITREMESIAFSNESFLDDPRFAELEKEFEAGFLRLFSLK